MEPDHDTDSEDILETNARLGLSRARDFAVDEADEHSDEADEQAGEADEQAGEADEQAGEHAGVDVIRKGWLSLPLAYMKPLQMCAVNQFVHCVRTLDSRFLSSGSEYVLVGTGASMPDHFHQWIYCMHQVIRNSIFGIFTSPYGVCTGEQDDVDFRLRCSGVEHDAACETVNRKVWQVEDL